MRRGTRAATPGFSIFYMGINLGAFIAPLICGYLGQRVELARRVCGGRARHGDRCHSVRAGRPGTSSEVSLHPATVRSRGRARSRDKPWSWGLIALVLLVVFGVGTYTGVLPVTAKQIADAAGYLLLIICVGFFGWLFSSGDWTPDERKRLYAIGVFFLAAAMFWSLFEQAGSTLNLFADRDTRTSVLGWSFPSSWFQSMNSMFVWTFAAGVRRGCGCRSGATSRRRR